MNIHAPRYTHLMPYIHAQSTPNVQLLYKYLIFNTLFIIASQIIEKHSLGRFSNGKRMARPVTFQFKDNDDSISLKWEQERRPGCEAVVCDTNKV